MKVIQFITWVIDAVGTVQYFSINTAFSYITRAAIAKLYVTDCQATTAIDIFSLEVMLKLFTPCFANPSPGLIIVLLGCLIRWAFSANETAISNYFLHIYSLPDTIATNGIQVSVEWQVLD
jgi:hypothetical protein